MNRTKRIFGSILLVMMFLLSSLYAEKKYPADVLIKDVDSMVKSLNRIHPNPYTILPKSEFDLKIQKAKEKIISEKEMDKLSFWKLLSPIIVSLRDQHTELAFPFESAGIASKKITATLDFLVHSNKSYIAVTDSKNHDLVGAELLSINGKSLVSLISNMTLYQWFIGFGYPDEVGKKNDIWFDYVKYSPYLYALNNIKNEMKLVYVKNHQTNSRRVPLTTITEAISEGKKSKDKSLSEMMKYYIKYYSNPYQLKLIKPDIGYIRVKNFVWLTSGQFHQFKNNPKKMHEITKERLNELHAKLEKAFSILKKKKVKNLIINIGGNGGGSDEIWQLLFGYLYRGKYRVNANSKETFTVEDSYYKHSYFSKILKKDLPTFHWKDLHYTGKVYLLIDRGVFSAAVNFANVMKYYKVATLVGGETAGWKTHFGDKRMVILPNTGLTFSISSKKFYSVNGTRDYFRGVRPDIKVQSSLKDFFDPAKGSFDLVALFFNDIIKTVEMIETNK